MKAKYFKHEPLIERLTLSEEYIDGQRHYVTPQGNKYKSVTTILSEQSKAKILEWRKRVGDEEANRISTDATSRGTSYHSLMEDYINNKPDCFNDVSERTIKLFTSTQPYVDNYVEEVYGQEFPLYSDHLKTAGRCDLFCRVKDKLTIMDFKTSSKPKREEWIKNYFVQCTVYALMIAERYNINVPQIAVLIAVENNEPQLYIKKACNYFDDVREIFCK